MTRTILKSLIAVAALAACAQASAQITLYRGEGFRGPSFTADRPIGNLERFGFNDRASSVIVERGRWEACEHARFEGRCVILRPGQYPSLAS
ncbi:MAG TPA: beta/gamma crystallin-related protein, partial [Casimicrobiaceae bacterium]|nr:beta/gamma crystallin-related protein [Casimicrobiaceae bacterium]